MIQLLNVVGFQEYTLEYMQYKERNKRVDFNMMGKMQGGERTYEF